MIATWKQYRYDIEMTSIENFKNPAEKVVDVAIRLHSRNLLSAADGNISIKVSSDKILVTPSGVAKAKINWADLACVNLNGETIWGQPSSEILMHLEIYRQCSGAEAVIHAHPPTAIAWTIAHPYLKKLPSECLSEVILATGDIPFVPYARPGTIEMAEVIKKYLPDHKALILKNHGALTWGESLEECYLGMERIENSAQILHLAKQLGQIHSLPEQEIEYLYTLRKKIGNKLL